MASPVDAGRVTSEFTAAGTSLAVNLPTGIQAGDLLIMLLRVAASASTITVPNGWTRLVDSSTGDRTNIMYRWADGNEGATVTVTQSSSQKGAAIVWRITGAENPATQAPEVSAEATASSTTPDPGSLSPTGGAKDYLWLWLGGWQGEQTSPPTGSPTNYSNATGASSGVAGSVATNCRVAGASRQLNAVSENPPSWTISVSDSWVAYTMAIHPPAAGGTTFQQSVAGAVSPAGALAKKDRKPFAGASSPAGAIVRRATKRLLAAITPAGAATRRTQKPLAGTASPAGALSVRRLKLLGLAGTIGPSGALAKRARKIFGGSSSPDGGLARRTLKRLAGATSPAGALALLVRHVFQLALTGQTTPGGTLARRTRKPVAGAASPQGSLLRRAARHFAGASSPTGAQTRKTGKHVAGVETPAGQLARRTRLRRGGQTTPTGTLALVAHRLFQVLLAGTITPAGALVRKARRRLAGQASPSGMLDRSTIKQLAGTTTPAGSLRRRTAKRFAAAVSPIGTLTTLAAVLYQVAVGGAIAPAGALAKRATKRIAGSVAPEGTLRAPRKTDYFTVRGDDRAIAKFHEKYGDKPKTVEIMVPATLRDALSIRYQAFIGGGDDGDGRLLAYGHTNFALEDYMGGPDTLTVFTTDGEVVDEEITGLDDERAGELGLVLATTLRFGIPAVLGWGSFAEVTSHGKESADNLWFKLREIYAAFGARAPLAVKPQLVLRPSTAMTTFVKDGQKRWGKVKIFALDIVLPETLDEMLVRLRDRQQMIGSPVDAVYGRPELTAGTPGPQPASPPDSSPPTKSGGSQQAAETEEAPEGADGTVSAAPGDDSFEGEEPDPVDAELIDPEDVEQAGTFAFPSGRHKDRTIAEIWDEDPDYVKWAAANWKTPDVFVEALDTWRTAKDGE